MSFSSLKTKRVLSLCVVGLTLGNSVYAMDVNEVRAFDTATITLNQAIELAVNNIGGKAYEASFDDDNAQPTYEIDIVKDGKQYNVWVDGVKGEVIRSQEDMDD